MKRLLVVFGLLLLTGCASLQPSVKAVCSVCSTVCPFVSGLRAAPQCEKGQLVVTNWAAVEKGADPVVECK